MKCIRNGQAEVARSTSSKFSWRWLVLSSLGLACLAGLNSRANAVADGVVTAEYSTSFASFRDPDQFLREMTRVMPRPLIPLTRQDAVAHELLQRNRTMNKAEALLTAQALCEEADLLGYDPFLFVAVIRIESNYNHLAISPVGAEGLMQLMPATAEWMADKVGFEWPDRNSFDPVLNVRLGSRYLALLDRQFNGRMDLALTAYNRGPTATRYILRHNQNQLPAEIRDFYATKVLEKFAALRSAYGHLPST